ncbi:hypothetical protein F4818DRAFT_428256 [Hypoxylon cercidicola]|nr:hypothetical protein F4818DRAFT_428256 [Hypoxylon cercidicola]
MYGNNILVIASSVLLGSMAAPPKPNFTAISARNGSSLFECWQLDMPFEDVDGGIAAPLGNLANASYVIFPPNLDMGLHNAPYKQWVVFTKGTGLLTLPDDDTVSVYVSAGEFGILFAADTADVSLRGHGSRAIGVTEVICLFIPTKDGEEPAHEVLHSGPCNADEAGGLREWILSSSSSETLGSM